MIDSKLNSSGMGSCETHLSMYKSKQSPIAQKKVALRDVQNDNRSVMYNYPETSCSLGGKLVNGSKLSGSKRSNPTCSPSSAIHQSFKGIGVNEHAIYASGEVDVKPGKKRASGGSTSCAPAFSSLIAASPMAFSPVRSSLPISAEKPGNFLAVAGSNLLGIPPGLETLRFVDSNGITDEQRTERLFNLQKLLKHYDELDRSGVNELLHSLLPSELSNFAINLEKRSMHLSVEEANFITWIEQVANRFMFFRERNPTDEGSEYSGQPSVTSERSFVTLMNNDFGYEPDERAICHFCHDYARGRTS